MRLLLLFLLLSAAAAGAPWLIEEGKGYGPVRLGQTQSQAEAVLGKPRSSEAGSSDPQSRFNIYDRDTSLLLNRDRKVLGITITGGNGRTAGGLGVGSSWAQVRGQLGPGLRRGAGSRTYPDRGVGFLFSGQTVSRVLVFKVEKTLPLQGDRILQPGQRAGDIRLGMKVEEARAAWGPPTTVQGENQRWSKLGVGLTARAGKVAAITLTTGDYVTAGGLKVGVSGNDVVAALGVPGVQNQAGLFYPKLGIGFYLTENQVSTVQIFPAEP